MNLTIQLSEVSTVQVVNNMLKWSLLTSAVVVALMLGAVFGLWLLIEVLALLIEYSI